MLQEATQVDEAALKLAATRRADSRNLQYGKHAALFDLVVKNKLRQWGRRPSNGAIRLLKRAQIGMTINLITS
jgi:hypothetical protein